MKLTLMINNHTKIRDYLFPCYILTTFRLLLNTIHYKYNGVEGMQSSQIDNRMTNSRGKSQCLELVIKRYTTSGRTAPTKYTEIARTSIKSFIFPAAAFKALALRYSC